MNQTENTEIYQLNSIHMMTVASIQTLGIFLKTGQEKDMLLPNSQAYGKLEKGDQVLVIIQQDDQGRLFASEKFERILDNKVAALTENQSVDLIIYAQTDLGYKAVINGKATGVLYKNEVFKPLDYGEKVKGVVKKIRADGKIDLILRAAGHKATEDIGLRIIELLEDNQGFYALTDKTPAEEIYELFGASKKKFKIALGGLYKMKVISVSDEGIRLVK